MQLMTSAVLSLSLLFLPAAAPSDCIERCTPQVPASGGTGLKWSANIHTDDGECLTDPRTNFCIEWASCQFTGNITLENCTKAPIYYEAGPAGGIRTCVDPGDDAVLTIDAARTCGDSVDIFVYDRGTGGTLVGYYVLPCGVVQCPGPK